MQLRRSKHRGKVQQTAQRWAARTRTGSLVQWHQRPRALLLLLLPRATSPSALGRLQGQWLRVWYRELLLRGGIWVQLLARKGRPQVQLSVRQGV